ncbi:MAG: D-2-hydroxyacid dehydrogenase [Clostridiales Family XIII bacterium]|nr:D-2-hydroxyacid dehydrogenase [Clostridiales Family XIII bacterium]
MKIVVLDGYTANPGDLSWAPVSGLGEFVSYDRTPPGETVGRIGGAEAVMTNKTPITREVMAACPGLRYIGVLATGYNVVDVEAAREMGVTVTNVPAYGTPSVAQHVFALLLELCHRVGYQSQAVAQGRWQRKEEWCFWDFPIVELQGKTLGVIGYGDIGGRVTDIALRFGMRALVHSRTEKPVPEGARFCGLEELLANSDVISLHCPLTEENRGLIREETIGRMKDGVMIVNTSRGPLIRDEDLAAALVSGKVSGAALDVLSQEPPRDGNPLLNAPNCIVTPHVAWASKESRQRLIEAAGANLKAFMEGAPINSVAG